jgi:PIN like domain
MEPSPRKSRKPSGGPPARPPEPAVFFIDRDTGGRLLAGALRAAGYRIELHDDHFAQDTKDPFWIRSVAERRWVILTCDRNIARKEPERSLFSAAPTHTFILYALSHVQREQRVPLVLAVLPKLSALVAAGAAHGIHRVHTDGKIEYLTNIKARFRLEDF